MKSNGIQHQDNSTVGARRWAAYAAAAAATAVAASENADAAVFWSGPVNLSVRAPQSETLAQVVAPLHTESGATFAFGRHIHVSQGIGYAQFRAKGTVAGYFTFGFPYASNLPYSTPVARGYFDHALASFFMTLAYKHGYGFSQFLDPGIGYLGFKFIDIHNQAKHGWARVDMDGAPYNGYTIVDYAYRDVDDFLRVGKVPEPGSLGLLAVGAAGLLAARAARRRRAKSTA